MAMTVTDMKGNDIMTGTKLIEYRITRQMLEYRDRDNVSQNSSLWADRLIAILAVTAALFIAGSFFGELLWAGLAVATLSVLR
jgi:hypothetical protein